ncbi:MAG: superoxide dismutase [Geobacteraceae bacterium GWC2_58_44]|nr:MAG: superoxide dismutase [Geobacteraceae bacterium GWC2_58_44]HBG05685.1 superoxide dismutase [Geobacter sp.]
MAKCKTVIVFCVCILVTGTAFAGSKAMKARADILDSTGKSIGTATLTQQKGGVEVKLKVSGLTPGKHGFHIHETGSCTPPDFKSAGPHFNPFQKHHGLENPQGKHAGDLPNLEAKQDGTAEATFVAVDATLKKGPGSLLKKGGTAIVIHADPDDNKSDPAGNAGARVACGVIVKAKAD